MAVPFRRTSKTAKRLRRTHFKLSAPGLVKCPNCGAMIKSHNVCPKCGYYGGKNVMEKPAPAKAVDVKPVKKAPAKKAAAKKAEPKAESK